MVGNTPQLAHASVLGKTKKSHEGDFSVAFRGAGKLTVCSWGGQLLQAHISFWNMNPRQPTSQVTMGPATASAKILQEWRSIMQMSRATAEASSWISYQDFKEAHDFQMMQRT
ncbi:uncharacterized protein LOC143266821 [Peromyscus maniculatus bairdii]|uniref:uncharacterized protein LOC143266821 n=1 Tax=Peromyscus maniculatus bairdii TaxID=230844 RepID=UPI003FCFCE5D